MLGALNVAVFSPEPTESAETVNLAEGAVVPMPTLTLAGAPLTPLIPPSTRLLLCVTHTLKPRAVALVIPAAPFEPAPTNVLLTSVVLERPAKFQGRRCRCQLCWQRQRRVQRRSC